MTGQKVIIRDYAGRPLARTVWAVKNGKILITNEEIYGQLQRGLPSPVPIGFSYEDVFHYDEHLFYQLERDFTDRKQIKWGKLKRIE